MLNMNTVKSAMHTIGDGTEYFAKRVGSGTADVAKRVGSSTAEVAKRVGSSTADLAKTIGPKRAIIEAVVIGGVVVGSILLMRYLRARKEELPLEGTDEQRQGRNAKRHGKRGDAHLQH